MSVLSRRRRPAPAAAGFTLTELALVLVIVSLLVGSLLLPLSTQVELRNVSETRKLLAEVREALLGYAVVNGRLPCPASATTVSGTPGAGIETPLNATGACPNAAGVVPWATLGVSETDAWGRRLTYRVTPVFAQCVPPPSFVASGTPCISPSVSFGLNSLGNIDVLTTGGTVIATAVPAIVVSHGRNGNGAFTPQGTQRPVGVDADELDNQLTAAGTNTANFNFVSRTPGDAFDDEVMWLTPGVLFNRMISALRLP